ncbi:S1C family serine protease [Desulforamulus hydrothermalis]|uniref:Putative enzyme n=1 Tax=Desulforamulus hydrothermalis Lam5 = DSM 18033 TaxID=1121428 RepID=K8E021_9FIRM|nr:trypsin-like peptidase domain-containing protein [Desulforamulus hydrothermalis]CCO08797.1 putative enzyme [Desulforamulus hydrothermalis Lam5 = DSM 18033]SHG71756.1 Do/DeqQ family serine protease [Desulforamulus hydrothermalis Lam5 = DSM 18033]
MKAPAERLAKPFIILLVKSLLMILLVVVGLHWSSNRQHLIALGNKPALAEQGYIRPANISAVVKQTAPAVVKIETVVQSQVQLTPFLNDPFFRQFFGMQGIPRTQVQTGLGSGFIVSEDGYIVTNYHVIEGASQIQVTLATNKQYQAKVVGFDQESDLAVLKINPAGPLPTLKFGSSESIEAGDWVIAIGNPYGLDHTVTVGVISAKGRPVNVGDRRFRNLLQTDASINPGNSGGPLLNLNGEVVGVNTAVNAGAQGIGFAIPSSTVKSVYNQLITKGTVAHPYLGVNIQPAADQRGVTVVGVVPDSPAMAAGLKPGDIILQFNGKLLTTPQELIDSVDQSRPGQKVTLLVVRSGQSREVQVIIGDKSSKKI